MAYALLGQIPPAVMNFLRETVRDDNVSAPSSADRAAVRSLHKLIKNGQNRITEPNLAKWLQEKIQARKKGYVILWLKQAEVTQR